MVNFFIILACVLPSNLEYGWYFPSSSLYPPGSLVQYRCDTNYLLIGGNTSRCLEDGTWLRLRMQCVQSKLVHNQCKIAGRLR